MEKEHFDYGEVESRLNIQFQDRNLLMLAFVHRSFWNENQNWVKEHNERLEFLGDSVLGLVLSEYLYRTFPYTQEGLLSELRARLVEAPSCVLYVQKLQIDEFLLLGRGERMNQGKGRDSILADLFEALVGAIYLDGGILKVKKFIFDNFESEIRKILEKPARNFKADLQDYAQKKYQQVPIYELIEEIGPPHCKSFKVAVHINQEKIAEGEGGSKKEAQAKAAEAALIKLEPS